MLKIAKWLQIFDVFMKNDIGNGQANCPKIVHKQANKWLLMTQK